MKIVYVIGADGTLGTEMMKWGGFYPIQCDVTKPDTIREALDSRERPDVILNLASKSHPDFCEVPENADIVIKTNVRGAYNVGLVAEERNLPVVLLSTDHIFDGKKGPYKENAPLSEPVNFYGQTKLAMESMAEQFENVKVVRTSYLFYPKRVLPIQTEYPTFMTRSFMYLGHFGEALADYMERLSEMPKLLHISGSETISWYEFGLSLAFVFKKYKESIRPRKTEWKSYEGGPLFAPRPRKGGLKVGLSRKLGIRQFNYLDGLKEMRQKELLRELGWNMK